MTRESTTQGVYAPNALSTVVAQTPFGTGRQYQTNASKPIFPHRPYTNQNRLILTLFD